VATVISERTTSPAGLLQLIYIELENVHWIIYQCNIDDPIGVAY